MNEAQALPPLSDEQGSELEGPAPGGTDAEAPGSQDATSAAVDGEQATHDGAAPAERGDSGGESADAAPSESIAAAPPAEDPDELRPAEIVARLDAYIVGQAAAKRAVAVALRNRVRRRRLPEELRQEVLPKNILMIGPTGVGKTEIARRLARLTRSPFIKVEATKFTEVGYVGRDVESIIRDLLEQTITEVHNGRLSEVEDRAAGLAAERILDSLVAAELRQEDGRGERHHGTEPTPVAPNSPTETAPLGTVAAGDGSGGEAAAAAPPEPASAPPAEGAPTPEAALEAGSTPPAAAAPGGEAETIRRRRRLLRRRLERSLRDGKLEERLVDVEVEEPFNPPVDFAGTGFEDAGNALADFFSQLAPPRKRTRRMSVADARRSLTQDESDRLIDMDRIYDDAIAVVEENGIVFVDEVDKIAGQASEHGPDISGQGVQRDLLPLLEGSTVHTRYGSVHTDHILYIGAGAFTMSKPSDLIPEMQGRFPIRVELSALSEEDLGRILVEPSNALTTQYTALLGTEGVRLEFAEDGLRELARQAHAVNDADENIGARRLFTILEKVLEELSFAAADFSGQTVRVDAEYVRAHLGDLVRNEDVRRFVL